MTRKRNQRPGPVSHAWRLGLAAWAALVLMLGAAALAQDDDAGPSGDTSQPVLPATDAPAQSEAREAEGLNLFALLWQAKWFMLPIFAMSVMVVAISIERAIALRDERVLPAELVDGLGRMGSGRGFDPREAYRLCQQHPSAAASVIRTMLVKIGRPHTEVEKAVEDVSEREAQRLYSNVRWLNLAAAVAPLMGLFGTVWGMMQAFHDTTVMDPGQNKADFLAKGIYLALVTTLGGLAVAIPAAIIAHWFEGRIEMLFHRIEELMFSLLPQIEKFEGRIRFNRPADEPARSAEPDPGEGRPQPAPAS